MVTLFGTKILPILLTLAAWYFAVWYGDVTLAYREVTLIIVTFVGILCGYLYIEYAYDGYADYDGILYACMCCLIGGAVFGTKAHPISHYDWTSWYLLIVVVASLPLIIETVLAVDTLNHIRRRNRMLDITPWSTTYDSVEPRTGLKIVTPQHDSTTEHDNVIDIRRRK